jgi:hypothetical protein
MKVFFKNLPFFTELAGVNSSILPDELQQRWSDEHANQQSSALERNNI